MKGTSLFFLRFAFYPPSVFLVWVPQDFLLCAGCLTKNPEIRHPNIPYVYEASHLSYIIIQTKSQGLVKEGVFLYNMNNGGQARQKTSRDSGRSCYFTSGISCSASFYFTQR